MITFLVDGLLQGLFRNNLGCLLGSVIATAFLALWFGLAMSDLTPFYWALAAVGAVCVAMIWRELQKDRNPDRTNRGGTRSRSGRRR